MSKEIERTDALGNPIVLGQRYGYSQNNNGITSVRTGTAIKITPTGKVTLEIDSSGTAYSDDPIKWDISEKNGKAAFKANMLFPLNN